MKATGIVRRIDSLGRMVLPKELRHIFDINPEDPVEIFVDDTYIYIRKYRPACAFCGNCDNLVEKDGYRVCNDCIDALAAKKV